MNTIKKYFAQAFVLLLMAAAISSCTSMDEGYKDFIKNGEISYTGKIDSLQVYSGKNRVQVKGLFISDPKITECRIYWDNRADSVVVPITRTQGVDALDIIIKNLVENVHNFEVRTFDKLGNASIPVYKIGTVYGDRYQTSLYNRPIISSYLYSDNRGLTLTYGSMDLSSGVIGTEVNYTDINDEVKTVLIPISTSEFTIPNYKNGTVFRHRTVFLPNASSIDKFYTDYVTVTPILMYIKNFAIPFKKVGISGTRWGNLEDWTANDAAKSHAGYGGWDSNLGIGYFNLESGWGSPDITNGKIYQTITLGPGTYTFKANPRIVSGAIDCGYLATDSVYLTVAAGSTLPDVATLPTNVNTLGYVKVIKGMASSTIKVTFTLTQTKQISFGIATTQIGNKFCNFQSFSLDKQ